MNSRSQPQEQAMSHQFRKRLGVSLLVLAVTVGVVTPRRASAMEGGTLPPQTGATEIKARQWDSAAAQPSFGPVIERIIVHPGDSRTNCVLDLDSGEFVLAPPDVDDLLRNRFDKVTKSGRPVEPSHMAASTIRLSLDASGQVVFDKKVITFEALEGILKKRLAENKDLPVFISSDTTTQYDAMLERRDQCRLRIEGRRASNLFSATWNTPPNGIRDQGAEVDCL